MQHAEDSLKENLAVYIISKTKFGTCYNCGLILFSAKLSPKKYGEQLFEIRLLSLSVLMVLINLYNWQHFFPHLFTPEIASIRIYSGSNKTTTLLWEVLKSVYFLDRRWCCWCCWFWRIDCSIVWIWQRSCTFLLVPKGLINMPTHTFVFSNTISTLPWERMLK